MVLSCVFIQLGGGMNGPIHVAESDLSRLEQT